MRQLPAFKTYEYAIGGQETVTIHRPSDFFVCLAATDVFELKVGDAPFTEFVVGLTFNSGETFDKVTLKNTSFNDLIIKVGLGSGGIRDNRVTLANSALIKNDTASSLYTRPQPARVTSAGQLAISAGVNTMILGEGLDRKAVHLTNRTANQIYLVSSLEDPVNDGALIWAGQHHTFTHQGPIWVRAFTAGLVTWTIEEFD
jgi:hypothetical protein